MAISRSAPGQLLFHADPCPGQWPLGGFFRTRPPACSFGPEPEAGIGTGTGRFSNLDAGRHAVRRARKIDVRVLLSDSCVPGDFGRHCSGMDFPVTR
jgi:hypothetical protein